MELTKEGITEDILLQAGVSFDTWLTLENSFDYIGLNADNNYYIDPAHAQFYFPSGIQCMLVRRTNGKIYNIPDSGKLSDGYVKVSHSGTDYQIKLDPKGIVFTGDSSIGTIHEVIDYSDIVALYKN